VLLGLRALFQPEAARGLRASYELHLGGLVVHARIDRGSLEVGEGPLDDADLVLETDFGLRAVLTGEVSPAEAVESGRIRLAGERDLLEPFVEVFRIPPVPMLVAS
jgi:putative sterol carrier protein